jgi:guanylate kinase
MNIRKGILFILSAPTGGGKTTIAANVLQFIGEHYPFSRVITYTTRPMRPNEKNGIDYHFVSEEDFLRKKAADFFLETNNYDGKWYGSPRSICTDLEKGKSFLAVTDRNGAKAWKKNIPDAVLIWLDVPTATVIADRLRHRGDPEEIVKRRAAIAAQEIEQERAEQLFDHHVMNDALESATSNVIKIITTTLEHKHLKE